MSYIYELGYGTCEESEFAQLVHDTAFSQEEFDSMVFKCVVKAAKQAKHTEFEQWNTNAMYGEDGQDDYGPGRVEDLRLAMESRLKGQEFMYEMYMAAAEEPPTTRMSYQALHEDVVKLMISDYGFANVVKHQTIAFFGWADLAVPDDWDTYAGDKTKVVAKMVQEQVETRQQSHRSHERTTDKTPEAQYEKDKLLCLTLGVEYIPFDNEVAVEARIKEASDNIW